MLREFTVKFADPVALVNKRLVIVPNDVNEEDKMPEPRALVVSTLVPPILNALVVLAMFTSPLLMTRSPLTAEEIEIVPIVPLVESISVAQSFVILLAEAPILPVTKRSPAT